MLDLFASVGATHFDVTATTKAGEKEWFRRSISLAELRRTLPTMLDHAPAKQHNIIVHPHGDGVTFIQLDDLKAARLAAVADAAFLTLETSPGNYQAWVALPPTRTTISAAGSERAPEPMPRRAEQPVSPAAAISRTSMRPTFRAWRSMRRSQVER